MSEKKILTDEQKAENVKTNKGCLKVFGYITLVFLGLAVIGYIIQLTESPEDKAARLKQDSINLVNQAENDKIKAENEKIKKANSDEIGAQIMAEKFVTEKLKSPSTADFCSHSEYVFENYATGEWSVKGWVDSQNGFGAMIRTKFRVMLKYNVDADTWTMTDFATE